MKESTITKERLSAELNKIFETEIAFQKLTIQELQQLTDTIKSPRKFLQAGARAASIKWNEEILNTKIRDVFKGGGEKTESEDKGPLGLGIIPGIASRLKTFSSGGKSEE